MTNFRTSGSIRLFIAMLLVGILPLQAQYNPADDQISLEEIWLSGMYFPEYPNSFRWMQDDAFYSELEEGKAISRYSIESEAKVDELVTFANLDLKGIDIATIQEYEFGTDENYLVLQAEVERIYRHSSKGIVLAVDRANNKTQLLAEGKKVSHPTFSPDGKRLAYVLENNLYVMEFATGKTTQITTDGQKNAIINGMADWVYEEEFSYSKAFWWAEDGQHLAYLRFDESEVPEFTMQLFGSLYPENDNFKYPKAGEKNSLVSVHIYEVANNGTIQAKISEDSDIYTPRLAWISPSELAVMTLNRLQNEVTVLAVDASTGSNKVILTETSDTYIEIADSHWGLEKWHFLTESTDFFWISEQDGFYHIYRYTREGELVKDLTPGKFEVSSIVAVDEAENRLYYLSTEESSLERHLYVMTLDGKKKKRLTTVSGVHEPAFSSGLTYFIDSYSSSTEPGVTVLCNNKGEVVKTMVTNERLRGTLAKLDISPMEFLQITTEDDVTLDGWMIKPSDFDESKKHPVLMFCYGGPGNQEVLNSWMGPNYLWFQMLAQKGYVVACVDNRGSGGRGREFRTATYPNLGHLETIDQVATAKWLQQQSWVDPARIGIWGWSYGGYLTSLCMTKGDGIFKMGIAVAPVTNWRYYDTIYTERYLKTPQLNPDGYDKNSPINFASKLKGSYFLVHGTGDDNVHVQNSMDMVTALVNANKQFDSFFYPNRNHGIYGGYTRFHLFTKMTDFVLENL
ncbi:MAG: S9 family peptidase [Bacteroidia bacterium]|nr:S9 family peptidase [Bacteroidia bacterium]